MFTEKVSGKSKSAILKTAVALLAVLFLVIPGTGLLSVDLSQASGNGWDGNRDDDRDDDHDNHWRRPKFCSQTAEVVFKACGSELEDDFLIATANCINVSEKDERKECEADAREERKDGRELCREQFEARLEVCDLVGEERYDPDFGPENFLSNPTSGNDYFPLGVGNKWVYEGGGETITVEVLRATKLIEGVTCIVVNDRVEEDGKLIENTDDWYAKHIETDDVWYCGEIAQNFETFEGDLPLVPELVDIEGSWKAGRDGAKAGILIEADPQPGHAYRQELLYTDAEDVAEVLSKNYVYGGHSDDPDSFDYLVPPALAGALCSNAAPCVVTRDFTALEPGVEERKYYAPGIGVFLEVNLDAEDIVQLVDCSFATVCESLPTP
jgi:hypothetical protein